MAEQFIAERTCMQIQHVECILDLFCCDFVHPFVSGGMCFNVFNVIGRSTYHNVIFSIYGELCWIFRR